MPRANHKEKLLGGALECLRTKGYAHTTSRDIAAAAGANLGSIGYHYGSKEALMNQALVEGFRAWTERISSRVREIQADDPLERLRLSWETIRDDLMEQEGLLQAFLEALAPATRSPELRQQLADFYRQTREEVAEIVAQSLESDPENRAAAKVLASLLIALSDGVQLQWFLEPAEIPKATEVGSAIGAAMKALLAAASVEGTASN